MIYSISTLTDTLEESLLQPNENANVEKSERILSIATGAFIFCKGITNLFSHPAIALGEVIIGGSLLHRGMTGFCPVKAIVEEKIPVPDTMLITEIERY